MRYKVNLLYELQGLLRNIAKIETLALECDAV